MTKPREARFHSLAIAVCAAFLGLLGGLWWGFMGRAMDLDFGPLSRPLAAHRESILR